MPSLFTKIINGEIPGRFIWKDDQAVGFLTVAPVKPGHVLVVPREEVDHWVDMSPPLAAHVFNVAQVIGQAIHKAFQPTKIGVAIVGLEVRHVHLHLIPINGINDMDFSQQDSNAKPEDLDKAADLIRDELRKMGRPETSD